MKRKSYNARWVPHDSTASIADVSFQSVSIHHAKKQANKIARELGVTNTPRTITCEGKVIECINTGVSNE